MTEPQDDLMGAPDAFDGEQPTDTNPIQLRNTIVDRAENRDLFRVTSAIISDRQRTRKEVVYTIPASRNSGEIKPANITLKTFRKAPKWSTPEPDRVFTLEEEHREVSNLFAFLDAIREEGLDHQGGAYLLWRLASGGDSQALRKLVGNATSTGRIDLVADVLQQAGNDPLLLRELLQRAAQNPRLFEEAAAAMKLAAYRDAVQRLRTLVEANPPVLEGRFQQLLSEHPWMFGSEYSTLLDRRVWSRDHKADFMLRRTTDSFLELIEIKTTLGGRRLFNHDEAHDSYYSIAELTQVIAQVQYYLEDLDADRYQIVVKDHEDPFKIRAKIIIGRDGDEDQQRALRRLNAHQLRIEILTFDQLLRIAENVLSYLERLVEPPGTVGK